MVDGIHYLNSGDWVETLSALTETEDGQWNVVYYTATEPAETETAVPAANKQMQPAL